MTSREILAGELVQFYLPCTEAQFERLPKDISQYVSWQSTETELNPFTGRYHWTLQTYLNLLAAGSRVRLCRELPEEGLIVSHRDYFEYSMRPSEKQFFVALLVDREVPHPWAQLHITHNPVQGLPAGLSNLFMRPWPQIGLLPRDASRLDRFENVYFVGNLFNLDPALAGDEFQEKMAAAGLRFHVRQPNEWHDLSEADVIIAVRAFGRPADMLSKPSIKLYNAWLAGVPIVIGYEPGCRAEGRVGVDYLEATSADEVYAQLLTLRDRADLRRALVAAGAERSQCVLVPRLQHDWQRLIAEDLMPRYQAWRHASVARRLGWRLAGAARERLLWRFPNRYSFKPV